MSEFFSIVSTGVPMFCVALKKRLAIVLDEMGPDVERQWAQPVFQHLYAKKRRK